MGDLISIVEACYDVDTLDDDAWLDRLIDAAESQMRARGVVGYLYKNTDDRKDVLRFRTRGSTGGVTKESFATLLTHVPASVFREFGSAPCVLGREFSFPGMRFIWSVMERAGVADTLFLNGVDATGFGCSLNLGLTAPASLTDGQRETWARIASHMAAGYRLRRKLRPAEPEAVMRPDGVVVHAEGDAASDDALEALKRAAIALETSRGPLRADDPSQAVRRWRGLISARWSLVERFEADGRRFLLARQNDPPTPRSSTLPPREYQAVALASLGHSNKLIAYEMGVSTSTVGVLLSRARKRLGAGTREELVANFERLGHRTRKTPG